MYQSVGRVLCENHDSVTYGDGGGGMESACDGALGGTLAVSSMGMGLSIFGRAQ